MNTSYFRIKLGKTEAIERLCSWSGSRCRERMEADYSKAVDLSLDETGQWKGSCLYVYEKNGWTVFEDLSGGFSFLEAEQWRIFAQNDEVVFAGYNDSIPYAEVVMVQKGVIVKRFMEDYDMPEDNLNEGDALPEITKWTDAASFVDGDELVYSDRGELLIF